MATTKPRITITLDDRTYAVIRAISKFGGQPMSTFVSDILDGARPTMERMAATFQAIRKAQDAERSRFLSTIDDAQAAVEPVILEAMGQFDLFLGRVEKAASAVEGADAGSAGGAPENAIAAGTSPSTNRGDTPHRGKGRKASTGAASRPISKKQVLKKSTGC